MADFNRSGGAKRYGGAGSRPATYGGGRPSFTKKPWGDRSSGGSSQQMYKATCSKCGKETEVPFRPMSGKPIYCRDCFVKTGDTATHGRAGDRFPRKEFTPRESAPYRSENAGSGNADVLKQLEIMNVKLERLIQAVENLSSAKSE